jgi:hypothetical protein
VRSGYGLSLGLIVLGAVVLGVAGGSVLSAITRGTHRVNLPGGSTLQLKAGLHVGLPDPASKESPEGLFVTLTDQATGEAVPVQSGDRLAAVTANGSRPLFQFEILDAGSYLISGSGPIGGKQVQVLILHESMGRTGSDLVVGLLAGTLLIGTGLVLFWAIRRNQKRAAASS